MTANGYILHQENDVVVIATGIKRSSANRKTGRMIQVWILRSDVSPVKAVATGADASICGTCPHRGDRATGRKRSCYVNVGQAPNAVYRAFRAGSYQFLPMSQYADVFKGRAVRLGAYGDPAVIPQHIVAAICELASKHTGYTHQWTRAPWLKSFVMASCDSTADFVKATHHGWRTFRVSANLERSSNEILCPHQQKQATAPSARAAVFVTVQARPKTSSFRCMGLERKTPWSSFSNSQPRAARVNRRSAPSAGEKNDHSQSETYPVQKRFCTVRGLSQAEQHRA